MQMNRLKSVKITKNIRRCPLCMNAESYRLIDLNYALFDDNPLSDLMRMSSCSYCGFLFYDTESTETDFNNFYRDHYFIHAYYTSKHDYQANKECYSNIAHLFRDYGFTASSRIIDVGCGQGQLIRSLKSYGFKNIAGVELCQDYVNGLNDDGFEAYLGSALDMPVKKEGADILIYKHIFEHFYNLHSAVRSASEHLTPGGHVFVAVPDSELYNSFNDYSPLHYLTLEHINHFDLHHIESLFGTHGMKLEHSDSRMLNIAEDYPFPIMSCLFYKPLNPEPIEIKPNFDLAEKMLTWFNDRNDLSTIELEKLQQSQKKVYVWGVSYRTAMYLAMSPLKDCNILGFLDIDLRKQNKKLLNKNIFPPNILKNINDDVAVVIGVGPSSQSMADQLSKQRFKGDIIRLL